MVIKKKKEFRRKRDNKNDKKDRRNKMLGKVKIQFTPLYFQ